MQRGVFAFNNGVPRYLSPKLLSTGRDKCHTARDVLPCQEKSEKKNRGNSLARDNLSSGSSSSRRADCCSSLSPISDCFFKAPVAEDINYPASVNHVICRPRPRGPRGDGGNGRGGRRNKRRRRRTRRARRARR